jgi:endoglucanase
MSLPGQAAAAPRTLDPNTQFFNPLIGDAAYKQINALIAAGRRHEAEVLRKMEEQPHAVWLTKGTPKEVRYKVEQVVLKARAKGQVPILVAYNIPGRDCAGLSAGGALTTPEYKAWIDAFAAGIGGSPALVMLEPDGLGLLPSNCGGPNPAYPFTDTQRYEELNFAVDRLAQQPQALVYLDGTHSHWLGVGDISARLVKAGALRAQGLYVNVSNYQPSPQLTKYGTWISKCIAFANNAEEGGWRLGHYDWCASQYFPANVDDFSTWGLTDAWYDANLGHALPTAHFVLDTSRNGRGAWVPTRA